MKKILTILFLVLIINSIFGQDTIYLNKKREIVSKIDADYFKIKPSKIKQSPFHEIIYLLKGIPKIETIYQSKKKKKIIKYSVWYDSGKPHLVINYKNNKKDGEFLSFWENGKLKRKDIYKKGKLISGNCWSENGDKIPFYEFRKLPEFPGGPKAFIDFLKKNISRENISNVRIVVKFFINNNGKISDIEIIKKSNNLKLDTSVVVAILNMPNWIPAEQDGKKVGVWRTLPLRF